MCDDCGCNEPTGVTDKTARRISLGVDLRTANAERAAGNRAWLDRLGCWAVNLVSSPGAGKTTLLEQTLGRLPDDLARAVVEGDQQTDNDARRIAATGTAAVQIETGQGCHLDADQLHDALHELGPEPGSLIFVENVGNLICPAGFDLGHHADVVLLSVTEGEDKPEKYPQAFRSADAMCLTKIDLLPHLDFDRERCLRYARALNPELPIFELSATSGEGMDAWLAWLQSPLPVRS